MCLQGSYLTSMSLCVLMYIKRAMCLFPGVQGVLKDVMSTPPCCCVCPYASSTVPPLLLAHGEWVGPGASAPSLSLLALSALSPCALLSPPRRAVLPGATRTCWPPPVCHVCSPTSSPRHTPVTRLCRTHTSSLRFSSGTTAGSCCSAQQA